MKKNSMAFLFFTAMYPALCLGVSDLDQIAKNIRIRERQQDIQRSLLIAEIAKNIGFQELVPEKKIKSFLILSRKQENERIATLKQEEASLLRFIFQRE